tara:strand:- start:333 stop:593 length:261 start_codon:yes stop_codon:yes gene_type:complete
MAYIGGTETVSTKPTFAVEVGTGLVTIPNTQSNVLYFDTAYETFVKMNVDTTTTLVTTNHYYIRGEVHIADTKTWTIAGNGVLKII